MVDDLRHASPCFLFLQRIVFEALGRTTIVACGRRMRRAARRRRRNPVTAAMIPHAPRRERVRERGADRTLSGSAIPGKIHLLSRLVRSRRQNPRRRAPRQEIGHWPAAPMSSRPRGCTASAVPQLHPRKGWRGFHQCAHWRATRSAVSAGRSRATFERWRKTINVAAAATSRPRSVG